MLLLLSKYKSFGFFELAAEDLAALAALDSEGLDSEGLDSEDLAALAALDSEGLDSEGLESVDLAALAADEWFDLEPIGGIPNLFPA